MTERRVCWECEHFILSVPVGDEDCKKGLLVIMNGESFCNEWKLDSDRVPKERRGVDDSET